MIRFIGIYFFIITSLTAAQFINKYSNADIFSIKKSDSIDVKSLKLIFGKKSAPYNTNCNLNNQEDKLLELLVEDWNGFSWIKQWRAVYSYNENLITYIYQNWNGSDWVNYMKNNETYNSYGLITDIWNFVWTGNSWKRSWKVETSYNHNNNVYEELSFNWFAPNWVITDKWLYYYRPDDRLSEIQSLGWKLSGSFDIIDLITYYYNDSLRQKIIIWQISLNSPLKNDMKFIFTYDSLGYEIIREWQKWDSLQSTWNNYSICYSYYNEFNMLSEEMAYAWVDSNYVNDAWVIYDYDENFNLIRRLEKNGNQYGWVNDWMTTYTYDSYNRLIRRNDYSFDSNNNYWINVWKWTYTYGPVTYVSDDPEDLKNKFYLFDNHPNPFNSSTYISFQLPEESFVEILLYDITGKEIAKLVSKDFKEGFNQILFDINSLKNIKLSSGIYFFQIKCFPKFGSGYFSDTKKMVLIK